MNFVPVESLPDNVEYADHKPIKKYLDEFMAMNVKYARVDFATDEYSDTRSGNTVIRRAAKYHAFPITVKMIGGDTYLIRNDI